MFLLVAVPKAIAEAGVPVINGYVEIGRIILHLRARVEAVTREGAGALEAAGGWEVGRVREAVAAEEAAGGMIGAGAQVGVRRAAAVAITTTTKVVAGLGAVVLVGDAIYSWAKKNPTRKSAEKLLGDLEERVAKLRKMKEELSTLK